MRHVRTGQRRILSSEKYKEGTAQNNMKHSNRFFENRECQYFPCHKGLKDFNCLFCYCPMYLHENCPGNPVYIEKNDKKIKDCTNCTFPHQPENYDKIMQIMKT